MRPRSPLLLTGSVGAQCGLLTHGDGVQPPPPSPRGSPRFPEAPLAGAGLGLLAPFGLPLATPGRSRFLEGFPEMTGTCCGIGMWLQVEGPTGRGRQGGPEGGTPSISQSYSGAPWSPMGLAQPSRKGS